MYTPKCESILPEAKLPTWKDLHKVEGYRKRYYKQNYKVVLVPCKMNNDK